nr:protein bride of sevenless isoform X1 [Onthophagus taurus]
MKLLLLFFIILQIYPSFNISNKIKEVHKISGDINLVYLEDCENKHHEEATTTRINSVIWIVDRLNVLQIATPLTFGLEIYDVCNETQYYDVIYQIFQKQEQKFTVGVITSKFLSLQLREFCNVLNIHVMNIERNYKQIISGTIQLLSALNWNGNLSIIAQEGDIVEEVLTSTKEASLCVKNVWVTKDLEILQFSPNNQYVIIGDGVSINNSLIISSSLKDVKKAIFVLIDGSRLETIPDGSYLIQGYNEDTIIDSKKPPKIVPTPIFFDVANPFINFAKSLKIFLQNNCNVTNDLLLLPCIKDKYFMQTTLSSSSKFKILKFFEIEPLQGKFNYEIFVSENIESEFEPLKKLAIYNVFDETFIELNDNNDYFEKIANTSDDSDNNCKNSLSYCEENCLNFWSERKSCFWVIKLRSDDWVYAILTISLLGVLFCIAIFIFIITRLCKKQIFEGNPTLTVLLLIAVILMYVSIVPFAIDGDDDIKPTIILFRSFCLALPYAAAFSLILSRVILLATASNEVGFMSHVAGVVQSFLTFFIFSVQCALCLQIVGRCQEEIFHTPFVFYLLSYNAILLILLLILSPLVAKSQRNYKEGRYFVIATILITCNWCCWIPGYFMLGDYWKDLMLCAGLVVTASILVGTIFIPRTYLITVSAARDRFTSALPSLAVNTLDVYQATGQNVYDCVNVTAINNHAIVAEKRNTIQEEVYCSSPSDQGSTASTINPDKLTRF